MNDATIQAGVHRFRDHVAIFVHDGSTVYISSADARRLSDALLTAAESIEKESFTNSKNTSTAFAFEGKAS